MLFVVLWFLFIAEVNYLTPITNSALHVCLSVVGLRLFLFLNFTVSLDVSFTV